jgi:hypothetical protein
LVAQAHDFFHTRTHGKKREKKKMQKNQRNVTILFGLVSWTLFNVNLGEFPSATNPESSRNLTLCQVVFKLQASWVSEKRLEIQNSVPSTPFFFEKRTTRTKRK